MRWSLLRLTYIAWDEGQGVARVPLFYFLACALVPQPHSLVSQTWVAARV